MLCTECRGCTILDCGICQTCRINHQFKDQIKIGRAECLRKVVFRDVIKRFTVSPDLHGNSLKIFKYSSSAKLGWVYIGNVGCRLVKAK